jgi:hypothetical protein
MPMLLAIGIAGQLRAVRGWLLRIAPLVLAFDAVVLVLAAIGGVLV